MALQFYCFKARNLKHLDFASYTLLGVHHQNTGIEMDVFEIKWNTGENIVLEGFIKCFHTNSNTPPYTPWKRVPHMGPSQGWQKFRKSLANSFQLFP